MIETYSRELTAAAAIGAGLSSGVYLAFSTFVLRGLHRLAASRAIRAMNSINKAAPNSPLLMLVLFGTGIVCVLVVIAGLKRHDAATPWQIAGAALYLASVLILVGYHVPRNNRLMKVDPNSAGAAATWSSFYSAWMAWNHARTLTALGGAIALVLALRAH